MSLASSPHLQIIIRKIYPFICRYILPKSLPKNQINVSYYINNKKGGIVLKRLTVYFFLLFFSLSVFSSDGIIYFNTGDSENKVALQSYDLNRIQLGTFISDASYNLVEHEGILYADFCFEDGSIYGDYGNPNLPAYYKLIAIPENADYEVMFSYGSEQVLDILAETGADLIYPLQLPVPKSGEGDIPFQMNEKIYSENLYYPREFVLVHEEIRARGIRLLPVSIFPVKYNPVDGRLMVYKDIQVEIRISDPDLYATHNMYRRYLNSYSVIYEKSSLGLDHLKSLCKYKGFSDEGILIITGDAYYDGLAEFVEWKEIKGYRVNTVRTSEIANGNTTAGIKAYIQDAYDNWPVPPAYIILVGDADQIPTFTGPNCSSASDQLYVFLAGSDSFPDASISRISIVSTAELATYLGKLLYYEKFENSDLSWMDDAALIAGEDYGSGHIAEGTFNYAVDMYLDPLGWLYDKLYRHTYDATKAEVIASMNAGRMISNYSAHCGATVWAFRSGQDITNTDVHALTNQDMYFYAIGNCCSSATFDNTGECIAEAFIRADNAAIGYWGASNSSYWDEDDILARRSYDGFFSEGIQLIAPNSDYAKIQLWNHYSGGGQSARYMEYYVVFGDGTTFIPKSSPAELVVDAPSFVASGSNSMNVSVYDSKAPVENAIVSAWMPSLNVRGAAKTNASGSALVNFDDPLTIPGEFMLTVTHPNYINYTATVMVGTSSDGIVTFDKDLYNCTSEVNISLMDADLAGSGTYTLPVYSTTDPAGIDAVLTETAFEGVFQGSILLGTDLTAGNGDTVTVTYNDADNGSGFGETKYATADIDCMGPDISDVNIIEISGESACIEFTTNEDATAYVNYGTDPGSLDLSQDISTSYKINHSGEISGLLPDTDYYFEIVAEDTVNNQNTSAVFTFKTLNIITIGDGNVSVTQAPLYCYYHDNRTQVIYLASDLGNQPLLISSVGIDVTAAPAMTLSNWTIRLKHTDKSNYSAGASFETDNWTVVYQSDETISSTGWVTFSLDTPFEYDGIQNLMVDFSFNNASWQTPSGAVNWTATSDSRAIYAYSDSGAGDPLDWTGSSDPAPSSTNNFINLQLGLISNEPEPNGTVEFDSDFYSCSSDVVITVMDSNAGASFVTVHLTATPGPANMDPVLPEIEPGIYQQTIALGTELVVGDGQTLTATYQDEDIGDGTPAVKTDTADIDCIAPVISNINITNIFGNSADISFQTDEASTSKVYWGPDCSSLVNEMIISDTLQTEHQGTISGLTPQTTVFYAVEAIDHASNAGTSACDSFDTANVISIGNGIEELDRTPLYTYYWKNRTSVIYLQSELGSGKDTKDPIPLYSLSMDVSKIPLAVLHNFTIRMKHTDKTDFSSDEGFETADWTIVYQNDETISDLGWTTFYFQGGPFVYDGINNLMIDISFMNSSYTPQTDIGRCYWTACADPRTIYGYADSSYGDPLDWTGTAEPTVYSTNHFLNIQMTLEESLTPIPPSNLTALVVSSTQVDLSWNDNSTNEEGFVIQRRLGEAGTWENAGTSAADTAEYQDTTVLPGNEYFYRVYAYNANGNSDYSNTVMVFTITLKEALDNPDLEWSTYGDAEWLAQSDIWYYGESSAQSGLIMGSQSTSLETEVNGPGQLSFYWKVSSESGYDYLTLYINGNMQDRISGEEDWQEMSCYLGSGPNTVTWEYSKDGSMNEGEDAGWVDYVMFDTSPDASISSQDITFSNANPEPGDTVNISARIRNLGLEEVASGDAAFYYSTAPNTDLQLITSESFGSIPSLEYADIEADWDTTGLEARAYILTVIISNVLPTDGNSGNNQAYIEVPLPVELTYFNANGMGNRALIEWMTMTETDNLGWNLYRLSLRKISPFVALTPVKLNSSLIEGYGTSSEPHVYNFTDSVKPGGKYIYILESVSTYGETEQFRTSLNWIM